MDGEFQKNESSEVSHELEREEYQDADELEEMVHGEENRRIRKYNQLQKQRKERRKQATPLEVGYDLSCKFSVGIFANRAWVGTTKRVQFRWEILNCEKT